MNEKFSFFIEQPSKAPKSNSSQSRGASTHHRRTLGVSIIKGWSGCWWCKKFNIYYQIRRCAGTFPPLFMGLPMEKKKKKHRWLLFNETNFFSERGGWLADVWRVKEVEVVYYTRQWGRNAIPQVARQMSFFARKNVSIKPRPCRRYWRGSYSSSPCGYATLLFSHSMWWWRCMT